MNNRNPIQPTVTDEQGVARFKENKIVSRLLDHSEAHGYGLNEIACDDFSLDDRQQLAQLIGYSLSGYGDLGYVTDYAYESALIMAEEGKSETEARIQFLEQQLASLKASLVEPMAALFEVHPDDLNRRK